MLIIRHFAKPKNVGGKLAARNVKEKTMAIRKSKEENFEVNGTLEDLKLKVENALKKGEFTSINTNNFLNQITANYKKLTVWGEISITLTENNGKVKIVAVSTANSDNVFALFNSPNKVILDNFKNNL